MRKSSVQSKFEKEERRRKMYLLIVSGIIIVLMLSSVIGFVFLYNPTAHLPSGGNEGLSEFGLQFEQVTIQGQTLWQTTINGERQQFLLRPSEVAQFQVDEQIIASLQNAESVGITFDPTAPNQTLLSIAVGELGAAFESVGFGATQSPNDYNLQQFTCDNATALFHVITIDFGDLAGVTQNESCYTVQAFNPVDLVFLAEHLRYRVLGVNLGGTS